MQQIKFDCLVIGGGVAGLSCALRAQQHGLKVAIVSNGQSALHFASGSIDLLSRLPNGEFVSEPFLGIEQLGLLASQHPYAKLGVVNVAAAMDWFEQLLNNSEHIKLQRLNNRQNHLRLTTLGHFRATWLSANSVFAFPLDWRELSIKPKGEKLKIALLDNPDFRDFQVNLALANLKKLEYLKHADIYSSELNIDFIKSLGINYSNLRSIDFANLFDNELYFNQLVDSIKVAAKSADLLVLPALLASQKLVDNLQSKLDSKLCELATLSPSLLGIRLENALKYLFTANGGTFIPGDKIISGELVNNKLMSVTTRNQGDIAIAADYYLLASGSFFSLGLSASRSSVFEPVFGLDVFNYPNSEQWMQDKFFSKQSHAFLSMGVEVTDNFQALRSGQAIDNLYCAGAMLAHYNPIIEGSGCGVAISSGFFVANQMIANYNASKK